MTVNTLQVANRLKAAEREGRAAEELALVLGEIDADRYQSLVTREHLAVELERLRSDLSGEIGGLRQELLSEMEKRELRLKHDMTLRLGAMIVAGAALLGGINVFF